MTCKKTIGCITALAIAGALGACGPDYNAIANRLRKDTLAQKSQIATLQEKIATRDATIADLQARLTGNQPPVQTLSPERLAELFTVAKIEIQSQTDTDDFGEGKGLAGFRIFIRMYDDDAQAIPASGNLTLEAIELPDPPAPPRRIGAWTFSPKEMKANWYSGFGMNHFAFNCHWQSPPTLPTITFRAKFQDALTGQAFEAELIKKVAMAQGAPDKPKMP